MKGVICFIAACTIYVLGGLIAWKVICPMVIDVPSSTLTELANYKLYCYTGVALIISCLTFDVDNKFLILFGALCVGFLIGIVTNTLGISGGIATTMTIIYNLINIVVITISLYAIIKK